ncbi:unnamed protein product, partial [Polarella glacialis]
AGGTAAAKTCDVSDSESLAAAFAFAEELYGGIDFVFANAGIEGNTKSTPHADTEDGMLAAVFSINTTAQAITLKYAVRSFEKRGKGGGTIVFTSSVASFCNPLMLSQLAEQPTSQRGSFIAYFASKSALDMIASAAHAAYFEQNIRVYNLNLAQFKSEMGQRLGFEQDKTPMNPVFKASVGDPIHVAEVIIAILDGTSCWPPGSAFLVDNDMTVDAKYFYAHLRDPASTGQNFGWPSVEALKAVGRDVRGHPRKVQTSRSWSLFKSFLCGC